MRSAQQLGDGQLVAAIAAGDQTALAEAYAQHASRVHGLAQGICGHTRAQDLTQEIFLQLWDRPQRYRPERGSLRSYLLMQAHSRAVDILRSDNARRARESPANCAPTAPPTETDASALAVLDRKEIADIVTALPTTEQRAIVLAYFGGHTYREVARLLDVPEGTVKSRIRSGLKRMRTQHTSRLTLA
ncbi:MAG TPA: sigma-70 family RNA polymerase sigma factor [Acidimicrobiales bacterium]|nr:sigma-70 family RNA polymerase sigma factor [Acidimicrobiales bacterium]